MKIGDLIRFNKSLRGLHNSEVIGVVIGRSQQFDNKQGIDIVYVKVYWMDTQEVHKELKTDLEVISEYRE